MLVYPKKKLKHSKLGVTLFNEIKVMSKRKRDSEKKQFIGFFFYFLEEWITAIIG